MNDTGVMCGFKRFGDLPPNWQRLVERKGPARDALREILALDELHDERQRVRRFFEAVDLCDVWMIQRGERPRFTFEAGDAFRIRGKLGR